MNEIWKPCYLFESTYQVSNFGRIKNVGLNSKKNKEFLSQSRTDMYGHPMVNLKNSGFTRMFRVCKLVAIAFLGAKTESRILHKNGDLTDCSVGNLEVYESKEDMPESVRDLDYESAIKTFIYDRETGEFFKIPKEATRGTAKPKVPYKTGYVKVYNGKKYLTLAYLGKHYLAHRVAMLISNGTWPEEVDHRNGDSLDNRCSNLRVVTHAENCRNKMYQQDEDLIGIGFEKREKRVKRWYGYFGKRRTKCFMTIEEARSARDELRKAAGCGPSHGKKKSSEKSDGNN